MPIKKLYILTLIVLIIPALGITQQVLFQGFNFVSSKTGSLLSTSPILYSNPSTTCVNVQNGVALINLNSQGNSKGIFHLGCLEKKPAVDNLSISASLIAYPNPTNGKFIVQCGGEHDGGLACTISLVNTAGLTVYNKLSTINELKSGVLINGGNYPAGTYSVVLDVMGKKFSVQLVKW